MSGKHARFVGRVRFATNCWRRRNLVGGLFYPADAGAGRQQGEDRAIFRHRARRDRCGPQEIEFRPGNLWMAGQLSLQHRLFEIRQEGTPFIGLPS